MVKSKVDSAPIRLIEIVWESACKVSSDSWRAYNLSLSQALSLAITSGMRFDEHDFRVISDRFMPQWWMSLGTDGGEQFFREAVLSNNVSAAMSFEFWKKRGPFIVPRLLSDLTGQRVDLRERRLYVGAEFTWADVPGPVRVTRFEIEGDAFRACSYKRIEVGGYRKEKVLKRFMVTRQDFQEEMRRQRNQAKLAVNEGAIPCPKR